MNHQIIRWTKIQESHEWNIESYSLPDTEKLFVDSTID
mgnify:CR=1 FL=1